MLCGATLRYALLNLTLPHNLTYLGHQGYFVLESRLPFIWVIPDWISVTSTAPLYSFEKLGCIYDNPVMFILGRGEWNLIGNGPCMCLTRLRQEKRDSFDFEHELNFSPTLARQRIKNQVTRGLFLKRLKTLGDI